jgi:hypothetical protein
MSENALVVLLVVFRQPFERIEDHQFPAEHPGHNAHLSRTPAFEAAGFHDAAFQALWQGH